MGIYDTCSLEYLDLICEPCGFHGQVFAPVEGITCPECGNTPTQVCYADQDSVDAGV